MFLNIFSFVFIVFTSIFLFVTLLLNFRQGKSVLNAYDAVPDEFKEKITLEEHQKAGDYTLAKLKINHLEVIVSVAVLIFWTLLGGMNILNDFWTAQLTDTLFIGSLFMMSLILIGSFIDLPFSIYRHFVLEEKFGFNKMTVKTFISDEVKGLLLAIVFVLPILYLVLYLMANLGQFWWFFVWLTLMSISLIAFWLYPTFIAPIFNKFTPLDDTELKQKIDKLLLDNGFSSNGVFIMDGSKRSSHGNAYFTGMGKNKRIVFFDTLLKGMTHDEIIAILAHELGHFHHKHIKKQLITNSIITLVSLSILGYLIDKEWFFNGLGVSNQSDYLALMLFMLIMPVFTLFLSPIMHGLSRKHEYEADTFAAKKSNAKDLISSLVKLYKENSSTLTPDKYYSLMHDSHPSASLRINHLKTL
jgi:STE24 endopeptidase